MKPHVLAATAALSCLVAAACVATPDESASSTTSAIEGKVTIGPSCSQPGQGPHILSGLTYARTLSASAAFQGCVRDAVNGIISTGSVTQSGTLGPYHRCTDSWGGDTQSTDTVGRVIAITKMSNPLVVDCDAKCDPNDPCWGDAKVVTDVGTSGTERFALTPNAAQFLDGVELASILLHEEMHLHGYHHGPTGGAGPGPYCTAETCGTTPRSGESDVDWCLYHTIPRIVDTCADLVLNRSRTVCGPAFDTVCGAHRTHLVTDYRTTRATTNYACACVNDPDYPACVKGSPCLP